MRAVIILALRITSCNTNNASSVREFILGVYYRHFESLYSKRDDTLIISSLNNGGSYLIVHKSFFQKFHKNAFLAPQQSIENWSAVYDDRDKILYEQKRDRTLSFIPDSNKLLVGGSAYSKIN